jgi:TM2 domain-containing membrane protein YozV
MSTTDSPSAADPQPRPVAESQDASTATGTAGWYPDPDRHSEFRFFDVEHWTDQRTTSQQYPPRPTPTPRPPEPSNVGTDPAIGQSMRPSYTYPNPYPAAPFVAPKNPAVSLLISFFVPGVGSMVNGDAGIGVAILIGYLVSLFLMLVLVGFLTAPAFWIWGLVDAYTGAQRWNARHGIIS